MDSQRQIEIILTTDHDLQVPTVHCGAAGSVGVWIRSLGHVSQSERICAPKRERQRLDQSRTVQLTLLFGVHAHNHRLAFEFFIENLAFVHQHCMFVSAVSMARCIIRLTRLPRAVIVPQQSTSALRNHDFTQRRVRSVVFGFVARYAVCAQKTHAQDRRIVQDVDSISGGSSVRTSKQESRNAIGRSLGECWQDPKPARTAPDTMNFAGPNS